VHDAVSRSTGIRWRDRVAARGIAGVADGIDRYRPVTGSRQPTRSRAIPPVHEIQTRDTRSRAWSCARWRR